MNRREKINSLLLEFRRLNSQIDVERRDYIESQSQAESAEEAQRVLQAVAQEVQRGVHQKISSVVSRCLEAIFEDPYQFRIEFERKRGRTEASLQLIRNGLVLTDPVNEAGGGVIDVAAFALRLACLLLERPVRRRVLVLDEPFSKIRGQRNRQRMRDLLESLADDFQVQMVICIDVDQFPEMNLGAVVELGS